MPCPGCQEYQQLTRRRFLGAVGGMGAASFLGLFDPRLLFGATGPRATAQHVILLWMAGGQSHLDTWDPKPGTDTGGPFQAIDTAAPGIQICQHFPRIAASFNDLSVIRSLTSREGNHERASYLMHTGYMPLGSFQHASLGSVVSRLLGRANAELPAYVTVGGQTLPAGHLGPEFAAYHIGDPEQATQNLQYHNDVDAARFRRRQLLLKTFDRKFRNEHRRNELLRAYAEHYESAFRMMRSRSASAFDVDREKPETRERYGATNFGQGCLLARRLVEVGVRFIEVTLGGWDTHEENFATVQEKAPELDQAVEGLLADLRKRELLHKTVVLLCSEFGRTPQVNPKSGRDHWPRVWSALVAGGGLIGGRAIGASTDGGEEVARDPVRIGDLHATLCKALDIDPTRMLYAPDGRPIRVVQDADAKPVADLFA